MSGENKDYLFKLEESLDELCRDSDDQHVKDLAVRVRQLEKIKEIDLCKKGLTQGDGST